MHRFVRTSLALTGAMAGYVHAQNAQIDPTLDYEIVSGFFTTENDGTFHYQGYLEEDGAPANGTYFFRFESFSEPTGSSTLHELYFESGGVAVVDGLFDLDVQMGGDPAEARRFWREVGDKEMYLEIGVGEIQGNYTTLGTRSKVGWSARAQYAGISESLRFPYTDSFSDSSNTVATMISLSSDSGGSILELAQERNTVFPVVDIRGEEVHGLDFGSQNGALRVDSKGESIGVLSFSLQYPIAGLIVDPSAPSSSAAVLGQVNSGVPNSAGVIALNLNGSTEARLATQFNAGIFEGEVYVDGDIRRNYSGGSASATPIAYGYVSAFGSINSGTGNFSVTWDSVNARYLIDIDNENYSFRDYTTIITPASSSPYVVTTSSVSGNLVVFIFDPLNGYSRTQANFQFVTYKDDPNITVVNRNNTAADDSDFHESRGIGAGD